MAKRNGRASLGAEGRRGDGDLTIANVPYAEAVLESYRSDPSAVDAAWRQYFQQIEGATEPAPSSEGLAAAAVQERAGRLTHAYRVRGHLAARLDPLERTQTSHPELEPSFWGLTDLDAECIDEHASTGHRIRIRDLWQRLKNTYCRSIGVQFMHIDDLDVRAWLIDRMERTENRIELPSDKQRRILTLLTDASVFETFLQRKYVGAVTFSLEGAESLIPLLDQAISLAVQRGVSEVVLGMAHRGRLNALANIVGKRPGVIFREFDDEEKRRNGHSGDVKYHLGHSAEWRGSDDLSAHISLCFNPSHLEFIGPVALGRVRAKQDRIGDSGRSRVLAVLIHGDAAFAGGGMVQETLNLSQLPAYAVGGAIHIVVNNQIGFTTAPEEARSSVYSTDVAKMLQSPIFHVNGEDPEAVARVIHLATAFRCRYGRDVVIDLFCYRRRGHNESDEPTFTQPLLYRDIAARKSVREGYLDHLLELGEITRKEADQIETECTARLEAELRRARGAAEIAHATSLEGVWAGYEGGPEPEHEDVTTAIAAEQVEDLLDSLSTVPPGFHLHPKIARGLAKRRELARGAGDIDWPTAELLALAAVASQGIAVRLSGQDSLRGTFGSRHAGLFDQTTGERYLPLQHLSETQARVEIANSPLSEAGVLGFEYGYSLDTPDGLVIWEAQFGDFCNAAQVIIDQFLAASEEKWQRLSGLVLLLPHGLEGMGPEHSSARLERFLTLAAADNLQVAVPTTPAQYFHLLRRQALRAWRKPLVVMTPKSLLRHRDAGSGVEEFTVGSFRRSLPDTRPQPSRTTRVLLCCGKIYYDLAKARLERRLSDVAIVRLEQLYPRLEATLEEALAPFPREVPVYWVQEEPLDMGAWRFIEARPGKRAGDRPPLRCIARPVSASPSTGSTARHRAEQARLIDRAFTEHAMTDEEAVPCPSLSPSAPPPDET